MNKNKYVQKNIAAIIEIESVAETVDKGLDNKKREDFMNFCELTWLWFQRTYIFRRITKSYNT